MRLNKQHTTAIILCGGAGQRMQGADKGLKLHRGRALVEWVLEAIEPQVHNCVISANRNASTYSEFGHPLISDLEGDYQGPLAGIYSSLKRLESDQAIQAILVSACDTPSLPANLFDRLRTNLESSTPVTVVSDGTRKQNLHCLIHRMAWKSLYEYYECGGRAVHRWQKKAGMTEVDFSDQADCFLNINSPEQLSN